MQINKRQLKKWIAALDSGEYKQASLGALQSGTAYCCLGVGCRVLIPEHLIIKKDKKTKAMAGGFPESQPRAPQWLKRINDDFEKNTGRRLSTLNDTDKLTFPEIATLLELVYVHKILD